MARKAPQLAKLTRPRLHKAVPRERLFKLLDQKREYPVVWISGPPGSGKTTLVVSYLDEAAVPALWYQIDPGDSDPATFFFYLRQAVADVGSRKAKPLPLFTPDYLADLPGFARRFLREGFARLPSDVILVIDNYHEIAPDSPLHTALAVALSEIPRDANVVVVSRVDPVPAFAQSVINRTIASITWDELRLTLDEAEQLARTRGITDPTTVKTLHVQSDGWVAGLFLMLEHVRGGGRSAAAARAEMLETVFDYFSTVILDNASPEAREVLVTTALLPNITADLAQDLTGRPNAIRHVDDLYRRHLFTTRTPGSRDSYQFHALFHAYLRNVAQATLPAARRCDLSLRAGKELESRGEFEDAFLLYRQAGAPLLAVDLFLRAAPRLIGQGRLKTVIDWSRQLPQEVGSANPWIRYWLAMALGPIEPAHAREVLKDVYEACRAASDETGQMMAAAGILDTLYDEFADFAQMDPWIEIIARFLERSPVFPSPEAELRVNSAFLVAASYRQPGHRALRASAETVTRLIAEPFDVNLKILAAIRLNAYVNLSADAELARAAMSLGDSLLNVEEIAPPHAAEYLLVSGYNRYLFGEHGAALARYDRGTRIAETEGLDRHRVWILSMRAACERRLGRIAAAERTLSELESLPIPQHGALVGLCRVVRALVSFSRGQIQDAIEEGLASQRIVESSGCIALQALNCLHNSGILISAGDLDRASRLLDEARRLVTRTIMDPARGAIALNQAHIALLRSEGDQLDAYLSEALEAMDHASGRARAAWYPDAMSAVFPVALRQGLKPELVKTLIRAYSLSPQNTCDDNWPWPVKVYTLGRFEFLVDDRAPEFSRKTPKKVITLLKAIVALGGKNVSQQRLADLLWPDEEGDAAYQSLTALLHRLRKLVGDPDAVSQRGREVSLNESKCWVDAIAFDHLVGTGEPESIGHALALYRGAFLAQDDELAWAIPARERLRSRFVDLIGEAGETLEKHARYEDALSLYLQGLEADDLVEPFYQGMIRCYDRLDRRTEAVTCYRRLRKILSIKLGVQPSSATERLYQALRPN